MSVFQTPEFVALFETYTAGPTSIGSNLARATEATIQDTPLLVVTSTDLALYPGKGQPPQVQGFRLSTPGFKELTAVAHLGPALASIIRIHQLDPRSETWRTDAERLLLATRRALAVNTVDLWTNQIAVETYRGRESAIAAMTSYGMELGIAFLEAILADASLLRFDFLEDEFLEAKGHHLHATVPFNDVMIAGFFLTGMDITYRLNKWFRAQDIGWKQLMVLVCGKQGRPTSGVTWTTNSVCQMILAASGHSLPLDRMYVAPHGPNFTVENPDDLSVVVQMEQPMRTLWAYTRAISELGPAMFSRFPAYDPAIQMAPTLTPETKSISEMPRIESADDLYAMTTRLRLVMEDPRQLLSGAVTDFAAEQLFSTNNDPARVIVPGLDRVSYPKAGTL